MSGAAKAVIDRGGLEKQTEAGEKNHLEGSGVTFPSLALHKFGESLPAVEVKE